MKPATLLPFLLLAPAVSSDETPPYDPIERYEKRQIEGWQVLVHHELNESPHQALRDQVLRLLGEQLYQVTRAVPAEALPHLRKIPFWVEREHPRHPCMCYHVSPEWLKQNGMNPQKAKGVEIANARNFLTWSRHQPWMVLHELAHGYHHQVLTYEHAEVQKCYARAVEAKTYDAVLHINGRKVKHYALNNDREYFAEATEAYFGTNDFYPFVRAELKQHDPAGFELMEKLWGVKTP